MSRLVAVSFVCLCVCVATQAAAQGRGMPPGMPPAEVKLTKDAVKRLLKALPEVTREASARQAQQLGGASPGARPPQISPQEMQKMQAIFKKHGFTMEDFAMQVSALVATYLALNPEAFDKQLPNENKPEIKALLSSPDIPKEQKDAIRQQIAYAQQNKEAIRAQMTSLASDANKKVVKPFLAQVKKVFEAAEEEARKAATAPMTGPRKKK